MEHYQEEMAYELAFKKGITAKALINSDGKFIVVNNSFCRLVEYSELELQHKKFQDITDPDDIYNDEQEAKRVESGIIESYEMIKSYITKTKKIIKVKLRVDGLKDTDGTFICFIAQVRPIESTLVQDKPVNIDINVIKFLIWLQKNSKIILAILTGLSMLGYAISDKFSTFLDKFIK